MSSAKNSQNNHRKLADIKLDCFHNMQHAFSRQTRCNYFCNTFCNYFPPSICNSIISVIHVILYIFKIDMYIFIIYVTDVYARGVNVNLTPLTSKRGALATDARGCSLWRSLLERPPPAWESRVLERPASCVGIPGVRAPASCVGIPGVRAPRLLRGNPGC